MDITNGVTQFLSIFTSFWNSLVGITFVINGISFRIIDITIGVLVGCIGVFIIRKIFYE